jgi:prepilin-type N-terminal cleavage/methylation domain-containing protein
MKKQNGFTLIELAMVIVIIGIIAAMASSMISQGFEAYFTGKNVMDADWQGRLALERMARDIREIRSAGDISTMTASQLTFVDLSGNTITYQLSGTNLMRNSQILANGIQSMTLSYFDANGSTTASASAVRYISISLNVTQNNTNITVATAVYARDLT